MTDIITQHLGHIVGDKVGALSGPNLAKEIAEEKVAGTVIACENEGIAIEVKAMLSSNTFKVFIAIKKLKSCNSSTISARSAGKLASKASSPDQRIYWQKLF